MVLQGVQAMREALDAQNDDGNNNNAGDDFNKMCWSILHSPVSYTSSLVLGAIVSSVVFHPLAFLAHRRSITPLRSLQAPVRTLAGSGTAGGWTTSAAILSYGEVRAKVGRWGHPLGWCMLGNCTFGFVGEAVWALSKICTLSILRSICGLEQFPLEPNDLNPDWDVFDKEIDVYSRDGILGSVLDVSAAFLSGFLTRPFHKATNLIVLQPIREPGTRWAYRGVWSTVRSLYRENGMYGMLFDGAALPTALALTAQDIGNQLVQAHKHRVSGRLYNKLASLPMVGDNKKLDRVVHAIVCAIEAVISQALPMTASRPFEVVARIMDARGLKAEDGTMLLAPEYAACADDWKGIMKMLWRTEGVRGFYKGFALELARTVLLSVVFAVALDWYFSVLRDREAEEMMAGEEGDDVFGADVFEDD